MNHQSSKWIAIGHDILDLIPDIGVTAISVFLILKKHANQDGQCWPSIERLVDLTGTSVRTVRRGIRNLEQVKLITVRRRRNLPNLYTLNQDRPKTHGPKNRIGQKRTPGSAKNDLLDRPKRPPELEPRTITTELKRERERALLSLAHGWNDLAESIERPKVRTDPLPKAVVSGWKAAMKDRDKRECFDDIPAILAAIKSAGFAHGASWFTLPKLFRNNGSGEPIITKLLQGDYDDDSKSKRKHHSGVGTNYDPAGCAKDPTIGRM